MHSDHYGLRQQPFQMSPDARLFYASSVHRRAFAHLTYGLAQREGFIVVTGEVGAGKTTLIDRMCSELDPRSFIVARIATTQLSGDDLLRMVADGFGADPGGSKAMVLLGITAALRSPGPRHLLIVDEAQGLSHGALEELRMLSNVTLPDQPPLQTILIGQPQLGRLLASPDLEQLRQRVLASYHLCGLTPSETAGYIMHRLAGVGWQGRPAWEEAALAAVHRYTAGIPRRINRLCARVMLSGALEDAQTITASMVEITAMELEEDLGGSFPAPPAAVPPATPSGPSAEMGGLLPWIARPPAAPLEREMPEVRPSETVSAEQGQPEREQPEPGPQPQARPTHWLTHIFPSFRRAGRQS